MEGDGQIIIDGVDVKNCRRRIGENNYCRYFKRPCSENNFNCVWKQLARKTQECEELKKELNGSEKWRVKAESLNEKLSIENDRYRKALEDILGIINKAKEE